MGDSSGIAHIIKDDTPEAIKENSLTSLGKAPQSVATLCLPTLVSVTRHLFEYMTNFNQPYEKLNFHVKEVNIMVSIFYIL